MSYGRIVGRCAFLGCACVSIVGNWSNCGAENEDSAWVHERYYAVRDYMLPLPTSQVLPKDVASEVCIRIGPSKASNELLIVIQRHENRIVTLDYQAVTGRSLADQLDEIEARLQTKEVKTLASAVSVRQCRVDSNQAPQLSEVVRAASQQLVPLIPEDIVDLSGTAHVGYDIVARQQFQKKVEVRYFPGLPPSVVEQPLKVVRWAAGVWKTAEAVCGKTTPGSATQK